MPFIALIIGAVIVIVAYNNTHTQLAAALQQDVGGYLKWALAIAAIMALGFIPGMKTPSRWLLALVALVILLTNYQKIFAGIASFAGTSSGAGASATATTGQGTTTASPTTAGAIGDLGSASVAGAAPPAQPQQSQQSPSTNPQQASAPISPFDPSLYVAAFSGFGGAPGAA